MKRSFHSRLTKMLREAHAACNEAAVRGMPIAEITDLRRERAGHERTRREFLRATASLAAAAAAGMPRPARAAGRNSNLRIVIVGAGLAGIPGPSRGRACQARRTGPLPGTTEVLRLRQSTS